MEAKDNNISLEDFNQSGSQLVKFGCGNVQDVAALLKALLNFD